VALLVVKDGTLEPKRSSVSSNGKAMELQAAKEIQTEVFHARPGEVDGSPGYKYLFC